MINPTPTDDIEIVQSAKCIMSLAERAKEISDRAKKPAEHLQDRNNDQSPYRRCARDANLFMDKERSSFRDFQNRFNDCISERVNM